ncbi:hypothetical protein AGABI2DRAFT_193463 [Agaricus bisporus var. bisporus H97]|uniref:hypothetical protein n=1 Tax=Agaricus bisporus var. bisporus (strain H97 / ATCC MYA-4626 / FGSC 10389) TaxID=936046 RepID=UPI00029F78F0|nr:hypothetical protein AGABI2DRAFT_193463 [Agaricus bisporus var. bisporus H97]EKV46890.1 hypothetical protein AGABI2DRAFT_193463 [Agaricus bisporus var. bisporus H97]
MTVIWALIRQKNHVSVRLPQPQTIRDENINSCQVAIGVTKTLAAAGGFLEENCANGTLLTSLPPRPSTSKLKR